MWQAYLVTMMHWLRTYLALFLACAMALTAHSAAAMRGMPDASGQIVICTGTGPETITVEADGQPVTPSHDCPECITLILDAVTLGESVPPPTPGPVEAGLSFEVIPHAVRSQLRALARAPPLPV